MITVKKRELLPSQTDPIRLWLTQPEGLQFRKVLASRVAELEAEIVNESLKWSVGRASGKIAKTDATLPDVAQSKLSLATRYQIALDVLNEMGDEKTPMSNVSLEIPYA